MKSTFLLPLKYILTSALLIILFTLFSLFSCWGQNFTPEHGISFKGAVTLIPGIINRGFLASAVLASFLVFLFSAGKRYIRFFGFLFMAAAVFIILFFLFPFTARITPVCSDESQKTILTPGSFNPLDKSTLYVSSINNTGKIKGVILSEEKDFSPYSGIKSDYNRIVRLSKEQEKKAGAYNPVFSALFQAPPFMKDFLDDIALVNRDLIRTQERSSRDFFLFVFVLAIFCAGCGTLSRLSRWPVFNFIISLLVFRLIFLMYRIFTEDIGRELAAVLSDRLAAFYLPHIVMFILSVLLVIWDILFLKNNWKRP